MASRGPNAALVPGPALGTKRNPLLVALAVILGVPIGLPFAAAFVVGNAMFWPSLILMGLARKVWAVLNRWLRGTVQLRGSCAVVTGGSAGIGRAVAMRLAKEGARVSIWARNESALRGVVDEIKRAGGEASYVVCDVSDRESLAAAAAAARQGMGRVDIVIGNAGIMPSGNFDEQSEEHIEKAFAVNVLHNVHLAKEFLPGMKQCKFGHFVFVASSAALVMNAQLGPYCATKAALLRFSEGLRMDLALTGHSGVSCSAYCPGVVNTAMAEGHGLNCMFKMLAPPCSADDAADDVIKCIQRRAHIFARPWTFWCFAAITFQGFFPPALLNMLNGLAGANTGFSASVGRTAAEQTAAIKSK